MTTSFRTPPRPRQPPPLHLRLLFALPSPASPAASPVPAPASHNRPWKVFFTTRRSSRLLTAFLPPPPPPSPELFSRSSGSAAVTRVGRSASRFRLGGSVAGRRCDAGSNFACHAFPSRPHRLLQVVPVMCVCVCVCACLAAGWWLAVRGERLALCGGSGGGWRVVTIVSRRVCVCERGAGGCIPVRGDRLGLCVCVWATSGLS